MQCIAFVVFILSVGLQLDDAHRPCSHPNKMSGQGYMIETEEITYYSVDFEAGRLILTRDKTFAEFYIIDIPGEYLYFFQNGGNCSFIKYQASRELPQNYTADQNQGTYPIGGEGSGQFVDFFRLQILGKPYWTMVHFREDKCFPVVLQNTVEADISHTYILMNVTDTIQYNQLYSPFDNCTKNSKLEMF